MPVRPLAGSPGRGPAGAGAGRPPAGVARHSPPVCTWNAARRTALASAGSGWAAASATSTWTVRGWPMARTSSSSRGTEPCTRCLQVADQQVALAVVGDRGGGVHPQPGGLLAGEQRGRRPPGRRPRARRATAPRTAAACGSSTTARTAGSAGAPTTRSASKARPRSSASSPRATSSSSATALAHRAGGEPGAVLGAGRPGRELGAGAQQVLGGLLDVAGRALGGDADLLQLDPHRPAAQRGERQPRRARGSRGRSAPTANSASSVQSSSAGSGSAGPFGGRFVAFGAQFGDPLAQQVEQRVDRRPVRPTGAGGQQLRCRLDDLGDQRRVAAAPGGGMARATRRRRGRPSRAAPRCRRGPRRAAASRGGRCRRAVRPGRPAGRGPRPTRTWAWVSFSAAAACWSSASGSVPPGAGWSGPLRPAVPPTGAGIGPAGEARGVGEHRPAHRRASSAVSGVSVGRAGRPCATGRGGPAAQPRAAAG